SAKTSIASSGPWRRCTRCFAIRSGGRAGSRGNGAPGFDSAAGRAVLISAPLPTARGRPTPPRKPSQGVPSMNLRRPVLVLSLVLVLAVPAAAKEGANYIVTLGTDTTSVESYVRTPDQIDVNQLGRAPRVLRRHFVYTMKDGVPTHVTMVVTA